MLTLAVAMNLLVWGFGVCIIAGCVLVLLGIIERDMAPKLEAKRDVERAALRMAGEDRFAARDIRV